MIEIIALVYLTRIIGEIAKQKGLPVGKWKLITVLTWFGTELFIVLLLSLVLKQELLLLSVFMGLIGAYLSYITLKNHLISKPDIEHDFDFEK